MENHGIGTQNEKMCNFNWKYPHVPHNLFCPSAQIGQLFVMFLWKILITCLLSLIVLKYLTNLKRWRAYCPNIYTVAEGHEEIVKFLLEVCKVQPLPEDRYLFRIRHYNFRIRFFVKTCDGWLMCESCHLDRVSNVEIGFEYWIIFVVVFFLCCCETHFGAPSRFTKGWVISLSNFHNNSSFFLIR